MSRKKEIKSFEGQVEYEQGILVLVRHKSIDDMRTELGDRYLGQEGMISIEDFDEKEFSMDRVHGFTIGEYVESKPVIRVFIPFGLSMHIKKEAIAHEAVHAALGFIRDQIHGKMFSDLPVQVGTRRRAEGTVINEEILAHAVGDITKALSMMIEELDHEIRKIAFIKGIHL